MAERTQAARGPAPTTATSSAGERKLPPLPLAAAGLASLSGLVTLASLALFLWDAAAATPIIQRAAPVMVIAGIAAVVIGSLILRKNKRTGFTMEGSQWASPAIVTGLLLMTAAVFLPLLDALSMLVDEGM
ncbi:MAG: hypothetical protein H6509_07245 [Bryobacterales bacterium]|nr:hypothetical protein [Bryobacterales bacterium]